MRDHAARRGRPRIAPETTVDPVVMAAATILRLQTIVSREVAGTETAVRHRRPGARRHPGNVIPDHADCGSTSAASTRQVGSGAGGDHPRRAGRGRGPGAARPPDVDHTDHFPMLVNDPDAAARTQAAFEEWLGKGAVIDPGVITGSEDVGVLAEAAGVPCVYWLLGGAAPEAFAGRATCGRIRRP